MSSPKSRRVGAVVATRYRDGTCMFACYRRGCGTTEWARNFRAVVRDARSHAASHHASTARYALTSSGSASVARVGGRRRSPLRRLTTLLMVLVLAGLVFALSVMAVTGSATPRSPSTTTTPAFLVTDGYTPIPAGPPDSGR